MKQVYKINDELKELELRCEFEGCGKKAEYVIDEDTKNDIFTTHACEEHKYILNSKYFGGGNE